MTSLRLLSIEGSNSIVIALRLPARPHNFLGLSLLRQEINGSQKRVILSVSGHRTAPWGGGHDPERARSAFLQP